MIYLAYIEMLIMLRFLKLSLQWLIYKHLNLYYLSFPVRWARESAGGEYSTRSAKDVRGCWAVWVRRWPAAAQRREKRPRKTEETQTKHINIDGRWYETFHIIHAKKNTSQFQANDLICYMYNVTCNKINFTIKISLSKL